MDKKKFAELVQCIQEGTYQNIHSLLVVKEGQIAFEAYFSGYEWDYDRPQFRGEFVRYGVDSLHNLASVTKSITSTLIGIAIDRGLIPGVDEKLVSYFPEYASLFDDRKRAITLHHVFTMTSGLEWNEMESTLDNRENDLIRLFRVRDPKKYILSKPVTSDPGTKWYYNSGGTNLLGEVIRRATGSRMDDFAKAALFDPLGITRFEWDHLNTEMIFASGNLKLCARDLAKLGLLFLDGGVWRGERIVSQEWIAEATKAHAIPSGADGYGYHWWLETFHVGSSSFDSYYAAGWGGQRLMVFPALELVVVMTGGNYVEDEPVDEILIRYILPASFSPTLGRG